MATNKTLYLAATSQRDYPTIGMLLRNIASVISDKTDTETISILGSEEIGHDTVEFNYYVEEAPMISFADWYKRCNYLDPQYDDILPNNADWRNLVKKHYNEQTVYRAKSHTHYFEVVMRSEVISNSLPSYAVYYTNIQDGCFNVATFDTLGQCVVAVENWCGQPVFD